MGQSFLKAVVWALFFVLIGVFQLIVTFFVSVVVGVKLSISDFLLDGFFLFLSVSICCSIVYEFYIDCEITKGSFWSPRGKYINLALVFFVFIMTIASMALYSGLYLSKLFHTNFNKNELMFWEKTIFIISFLYALGLKWIIYYHNDVKKIGV